MQGPMPSHTTQPPRLMPAWHMPSDGASLCSLCRRLAAGDEQLDLLDEEPMQALREAIYGPAAAQPGGHAALPAATGAAPLPLLGSASASAGSLAPGSQRQQLTHVPLARPHLSRPASSHPQAAPDVPQHAAAAAGQLHQGAAAAGAAAPAGAGRAGAARPPPAPAGCPARVLLCTAPACKRGLPSPVHRLCHSHTYPQVQKHTRALRAASEQHQAYQQQLLRRIATLASPLAPGTC